MVWMKKAEVEQMTKVWHHPRLIREDDFECHM